MSQSLGHSSKRALLFIVFCVLLSSAPYAVNAWTRFADFEQGTIGQRAQGPSGFGYATEQTFYSNTRVFSGSKSAITGFIQGQETGAGGAVGWAGSEVVGGRNLTEGDEIWSRGYFYFASPWSWYAQPVSKIVRIRVNSSDNQHIAWHSILASSTGKILLSNEVQAYQPTSNVDLDVGQWQSLEIYVKFSATAGQGVIRIWKNGILVLEDTTRRTLAASSNISNQANVFTWWNLGPSQTQYAWLDDFIWTNERPANRDAAGNYMIGPIGWSSTSDTTPPTSPTNLAATAPSSSSISVSWTASTDAVGVTGYLVERCQGSGCSNFTQVGTPTASPFVDSGLTADTFYNYHVRATDAAGNLSGWSNVVGATTQFATPAPAFTLSTSPTSITTGSSSTLTWSAVTNATSCSASGGTFTGSKPTSGGTQSVSPTSTTTYTLSCTGTGGTTNRSVTVTVQPASGCSPVSIYPTWDQNAFSAQTGTFTYTFSATPNTSTGALFGHSNGAATGYNSLATTVRFRDTGSIDAINGGVYASVSSTNYTLGTRYTFRMTVNVAAKTYSAFVTPEGQAERTIASNYAFRTAQTSVSQLNNFSSSDDVGTSGSITICNPQLSTSILIPCNTVTTANFSQATYNSYGAPFDPFTSNTPLLNVTCTSTDPTTINLTTGITGDTTRIVYTKGYWYDSVGTAWRQYSGTCTGALNGEWCQGSVSATITDLNVSTASSTTPTYLVGMTCSVQGGSWKCGCRDTTCANFSWQIQGAGM